MPEFVFDLQLFAGEKTEPATPRRREEARKKGQVAKSSEIGTALLLISGFYMLNLIGTGTLARLRALMVHVFQLMPEWDGQSDFVYGLGLHVIKEFFLILLPFFGVLTIIAILSQGLQVGILTTWDALTPKFSRINPIEGVKRIFSKRALVEFSKSLFKIAVVGYLAYHQVAVNLHWLPGLLQMNTINAVILVGQVVLNLALWTGIALLILAAIDYLYQRWEFEQSIMMTKQEIKDEFKQTEGDPQIRSKIRQRQRQLSAQRMMESIPSADVVITNPIHFAVALQYEAGKMAAPKVVAKGAGYVALRIREIAEENQVIVVENPPLARTLYSSAEIGQEVPEDLYPAVAEVLAFVYRLKRQRAAH